ncbi:uncharacterized protein JCM15063_001670 [Sporobolomyces koalae]|uniref:uncharacterized protein n=1 Tax=Sporobolomyces koalae TaxID=500713 RepID=UPI0031709F7A
MASLPFRVKHVAQLAVLLLLGLVLYLTYDRPLPLPRSTSIPVANAAVRSTRWPATTPAPVAHERTSDSSHRVSTTNVPWTYTKPVEELELCRNLFLFTFVPWWGFASEFILYIRAKAMADHLGYTFLPDDSAWNYGRLATYFEPLELSCRPPPDWNDHRKAYPIKQGKSWQFDSKGRPRRRLRYSRAFLANLDDWTRETYFANSDHVQTELATLSESDARHRRNRDRDILAEGDTLPRVFERVFADHADAVRDTWRLNHDMQREVTDLARTLGLDSSDVTRGPVIGVHIRLGDKATEYKHDSEEMGITNKFGNLTTYVVAAHNAYDRLVRDRHSRFSPDARPTLLLMTAEPGIAEQIAKIPLAKSFKIQQTPPPLALNANDLETSERLSNRDRPENGGNQGPKAYAIAATDSENSDVKVDHDIRNGYTQATFNSLPLETRIKHTRAFVRDLALVTSDKVDALVVSGASNIGRLAMLIGGLDAVIGSGRIRSIDAHFYPTSYPSSVYSHTRDVEDLDHAAFLPDEQVRNRKKQQPGKANKAGSRKKAVLSR